MRMRLVGPLASVVTLVLVAAAMAATINGTQGPDVIKGTGKADTISAGAGDDLIYGQGGNDIIRGNKGADRLYGGLGNDYIAGGPRQAGLEEWELPRDWLFGRAGNDTLVTTGGAGHVEGGAGNDTLWTDNRWEGAPGGNWEMVSCGAGHDIIHADSADEPNGPEAAWGLSDCEVVYVDGELWWLNGAWIP
jgi:large repetitive protein